MRRDAQKDPVVFPEALRAKLLVNQVDFTTVKFILFMHMLLKQSG